MKLLDNLAAILPPGSCQDSKGRLLAAIVPPGSCQDSKGSSARLALIMCSCGKAGLYLLDRERGHILNGLDIPFLVSVAHRHVQLCSLTLKASDSDYIIDLYYMTEGPSNRNQIHMLHQKPVCLVYWAR